MTLVCFLLLTGCSPDSGLYELADDELVDAVFGVEGEVPSITRGAVLTKYTIDKYGLYGFSESKSTFAKNVLHTKQPDGSWKSKKWSWPTKGLSNFYAVNADFTTLGNNLSMQAKGDKEFEFLQPLDARNHHYLMMASLISQAETTDKQVKLTFTPILSTLYVGGMSSLDVAEVKVGGLKLHNVIRRGTFKFNETKKNKGDWTLPSGEELTNDDYVTYTRMFLQEDGETMDEKELIKGATAIQMPSKDSAFFLIPQTLTAWDPGTPSDDPEAPTSTLTSIAQADQAHQCYFEVLCKIKDDVGYLLGSETTYGSLYVPYGKNLKLGTATTFKFDLSEAYTADGLLFKNQTDNNGQTIGSVEVDTNRKFGIGIDAQWESTQDDVEILSF